MATKPIELDYQYLQSDGSYTRTSGVTCYAEVTALSGDDAGKQYDSTTDAFVTAGAQTNPSSTGGEITAVITGSSLFRWLATVTGWANGDYYVRMWGTHATYKEMGLSEVWTIYGGAAASASPSAPSAPDTCRVYLYLNDSPASAPTSTVRYLSPANTSTNVVLATVTPTYSSGTGLWYVDVLQGETVLVSIPSYNVRRRVVAPALTTATLIGLEEVA